MKKTLLLSFIIGLFVFSANAQIGQGCEGCDSDKYNSGQESSQTYVGVAAKKKKISIYPNPAVNFIGLSDSEDVKKIVIFNVMGREAKSFDVEKGVKYNVADLKTGMYLVQIVGYNNKVITTQRLNKG
jgi:type IX secretion system substrate protein